MIGKHGVMFLLLPDFLIHSRTTSLFKDPCYLTPELLQVPWSCPGPASGLERNKLLLELLSVLTTQNT